MTLNWIDVTDLSFNTLLLLEREQLTWLEGWLPEPELAAALKTNPAIEWYLRNKNPDLIDIVMGGYVFGDNPKEEHAEMARVAKPGGMVILCPGNNDRDEGWHQFLINQGFEWSRFEEPGDGLKRKYWKSV